jgi:cell division protein FtsW (lipid II flippase)
MIAAVTRTFPPLGWIVLLTALALTSLGLIGVYVGETAGEEAATQTIRQAGYLGLGLCGVLAIQVFGYKRIGGWAYPLFGIILVLLVLLVVARKIPLAPIIPARRNTFRWIVLGPVNIQVSEYTKLAFIIALAAYLRFRTNYRTIRGLFWPFILTLIPVGLILKEPDLGTSLLLLPTLFIMLYAAGAKVRHLLLILTLGLASAPVYYFSPLMSQYQRDRITSLFKQDDDDDRWRLASGYQLNQSKIALGSGRAMGRGLHEGSFFKHDLLPEEHNDFIFAVIGHQWGFFGCLAVVLAYLVLIAAGLTIASMTVDPLGRLLAVGVCALILAQAVINIGMTIGLTPITGMTLPFVSMGGSALVANYLSIGILIDVARRRPIEIARKPFEFAEEVT